METSRIIVMIMPVLAGIFGGLVGGYVHGKNKSRKRRVALYIAGFLLLAIYAVALVYVFTE